MSGRAATGTVIPGRFAVSVGDPKTPLPPGWKRELLTAVAELGTGHTPSRRHPEYWGGDVFWMGVKDAGRHHGEKIIETSETITIAGLNNSSARLLPKDTICLSRTASVGYVVRLGREMATSQDFVTWSCTEALDPDYLMAALLAEGEHIRRFGKGTTHTTIYFPEVKSFHIALPPLAEQRRIVGKLDALSARSKRASAELERVEALAERARQAVLAAAFEPLRGAARSTLNDELAVLTSGSRDWAQYYDRGSGVFVLAGNIRPLFFDPSPKRFVDPPRDGADARRSRIARGDLLLTIVGAGTGDLCHVDVDVPDHFVCQSVALLRLRRPGLAKFLAYWFNWIAGGRGDINAATYGAARPHLSFEQIKGFLVPTPTDGEARTAVARIDAGLSALARLVAEARAATGLVSRLEQSILSRAFRGELVPQDPSDEPASVLLDRIRAGVSSQASKRRRRAG